MTRPAIEISSVSKRYDDVWAVREASFAAHAGRVTGLLGANGAGKSTTLRILLGLARPDSGTTLVAGVRYRDLRSPARTIGALLDLAGAHPAMTARAHLRTYGALGGLPHKRVDQTLAAVGADEYADRRIGTFSTGMRQRLGLATALLGEPEILVLDEPLNGLDPAGIAWLRSFLRRFADDGGTVLLSSHVLNELEHTVDDVVVLDRGRVRWSGTLAETTADGRSLETAFLQLTEEVAA
jgi:ABC-2 type transport system ATP-binding protein